MFEGCFGVVLGDVLIYVSLADLDHRFDDGRFWHASWIVLNQGIWIFLKTDLSLKYVFFFVVVYMLVKTSHIIFH